MATTNEDEAPDLSVGIEQIRSYLGAFAQRAIALNNASELCIKLTPDGSIFTEIALIGGDNWLQLGWREPLKNITGMSTCLAADIGARNASMIQRDLALIATKKGGA